MTKKRKTFIERRQKPACRFRRMHVEPLEQRSLLALTAQMVTDLNEGSGSSSPRRITSFNDAAYFMASAGAGGHELWKLDRNSNLSLVKEINPTGPSFPRDFAVVNETLFFRANDGTNGFALWKTDGTTAGTVLVKDINPGTGGLVDCGPYKMHSVNGALLFVASNGVSGCELFRSDGTPEGTVLVKDINPGPSNSFHSGWEPVVVNGTYFFLATDGTSDVRLWKSDGTPAGTVMVKEIGGGYSTPLASFNGHLILRANDVIHEYELWKSDGTTAGTQLIKDFTPGPTGGTDFGPFFELNGLLYFGAQGGLWRTDLTDAGTVLVKSGIYPNALVAINGTLFIGSWNYDGPSRRGIAELWKSDGTPGGTVLLKRLSESPMDCCFPASFTNFGGRLFFTGGNDATGRELWTSDGTEAGTFIVRDIFPGSGASDPGNSSLNGFNEAPLTIANGNLIFNANDGVHGDELWMAVTSNTIPSAQNKSITTSKDAAIGVLLVASDLDNGPQPLTYTVIDQPQHGTVSGAGPNVTYTPASGYVGPDSFTFRAKDGQDTSNLATVSIAVAAVNQAPVASDKLVSLAEDATVALTLLASDAESGVLTYTIVDPPLHGRLFGTAPNLTYEPDANYHGSDRFTFRASDGALDSNLAVVLITVMPVNDPPVAGGAVLLVRQSDGPKPVVFEATDADGDPLTFSVITQPQYGRLIQQGDTWLYERPATPVLLDEFQYQASDGQSLSNIATFTVVNFDLIVFAEDGTETKEEWAQKLFPSVPPGGSPDISFITTNDNPNLFSDQPAIDSTGTLTFTPAPNSSGTATVTVVLQTGGEGEDDGGGDEGDTATFTIEVIQKYPAQNDNDPNDVNNDGWMVAGDALDVINYLNGIGPGTVPPGGWDGPFYDVTGDNFIAASDALDLIDIINASLDNVTGVGGGDDGEGEGAASETRAQLARTGSGTQRVPRVQGSGSTGEQIDVWELLAMDAAWQQGKRRMV